MNSARHSDKITPEHLARKAVVYLRQSSEQQVRHNTESQRLQYQLVERARELGWNRVEVLDADLGASASLGAAPRRDFDTLLASVARGEVGIVFGRAVARLSRTDKDWCHLLEVCQLFRTLLGNAEQVYDLGCTDDQLVLGIKGTMSVFELNVLKMRMLEARREKAQRGELFSLLPSGYVLDVEGKVVRDPDLRVQQAIASVFRKVGELWSVRQTLKWFHEKEVELPVHQQRRGRTQLIWKLPTYSFLIGVLHNPFYAGAYTYGRRHTEMVLVEGRIRRRTGRLLAPEECRVFIRDHHEGYIDWETYEHNQRMMRKNSVGTAGGNSAVAAVRTGQGLLVGLLRCGRCGRNLHVRYSGRSGTAARYRCKGDADFGGSFCLNFGGPTVDRRFSEELLRVLSPLGIEASLEALDRFGAEQAGQRQALGNQLHQAEYEALRAFEQYDEVDPRNRLVALELERRWEAKLEQVDRLKAGLAVLEQQAPALGEDERRALVALGVHFAGVWSSDRCPVELKKKIIRTVVEEVIVDLDEETQKLLLTIHWNGGTHTRFEMDKPGSREAHKTAAEDLEIIGQMAPRYGDGVIAGVLNRLGRRTATGKRWTQDRVMATRRSYSIPGRRKTRTDPEVLNRAEAAQYCGVSDTTIRRLVSTALLPMNQVVSWAPWEIRRADLDSEPVRGIIKRLHETGRLTLEGDGSASQLTFFE